MKKQIFVYHSIMIIRADILIAATLKTHVEFS